MNCTKCKIKLNIDNSSYKNKEKKIFQSSCKECNKAYQKQHYINNKELYKGKTYIRNTNIVKENREKAVKFLLENPCVDCGETDPIVLEFDHVRGIKLNSVSKLIGNKYSWKRIKEEIDKCEVRCSNCHKRKTAKQFGFYGYMAVSSIG